MTKVMIQLKALASGIGKQDADTLYNFFEIASEQLDSIDEKEAFRQGALAMFADVGKMRLKRFYHTFKFRKAMKKLK